MELRLQPVEVARLTFPRGPAVASPARVGLQYQVVQGTRDARRAPVHECPWAVWYRVEPDESIAAACLAHRGDAAFAQMARAAATGADVTDSHVG